MTSLYLVRHGIAADQGGAYPTDASRPLTDDGIARWRLQVRGLGSLDVEINHVLSSPLLRCRQTADLLADGLGGRAAVTIVEALGPGGRLEEVVAALGACRHAAGVALVGHEPSIGHLAAHVLGAHASIPFKKGAVCRIDVASLPPRAAGTLVWFLPPKAQRALA